MKGLRKVGAEVSLAHFACHLKRARAGSQPSEPLVALSSCSQ